MKTSYRNLATFRNLAVLLVAQVAIAAEPAPVPPQASVPDKLADTRGREPLDGDRLAVLAKSFCVMMQQHHGDKNANALREFFDPRYLQQHGLTERDLAVELVNVRSIHTLIVGDDKRTALCIVSPAANGPESERNQQILVFRAVVSEQGMFLAPANPPDPATGRITPWVIRTNLPVAAARPEAVPAGPVGKWKVQFANGVNEACSFGDDGKAVVEEPLRQSRGTVVVKDGAVVIPCEDDRIERWTAVGGHFIVEHWAASSQYPAAAPVLGIARRAR